jgi:hypothetical protein
MRDYAKMQEYKKAVFKLLFDPDWNLHVLEVDQIDQYIWRNNLITFKHVEEGQQKEDAKEGNPASLKTSADYSVTERSG